MIAQEAEDVFDDLEGIYQITDSQRKRYQEQGFIHLKEVLSAETLAFFEAEVTQGVRARNQQHKPMAERTTYEQAFLQVENLWVDQASVRPLVFSRRLAGIAAALMGSAGVRLYHDQALYKEPGGGITPFHADQYYWPLATLATCTAWIPLQATPLEMGPLEFLPGSHRLEIGRDLAIGDESEQVLSAFRERESIPMVQEPFALGDVSFHSGWTFHHASPNHTDRPRAVMTIIYMDRDARVHAPIRPEQANDLATWMPGIQIGAVADSPLNPVLYPVEH